MIAAPDLVVACPYCQAVARVFEVSSGDFAGVVTWTDGYQDTPMMPRPPRITRCPHCRRIFWTGEATPVGYLHGQTLVEHPEWQSAPHLEPLDYHGVGEAMANGLAYNPELELELRVLWWWRVNDAFRRDDAPIGYSESPEAVANMQRLIELMANGEEDLLLFRAEALRHLGRFKEAAETLEGVGCSAYWPAKSRLLEVIERGDRKLRKLCTEEAS
jgi:hypothetical protein